MRHAPAQGQTELRVSRRQRSSRERRHRNHAHSRIRCRHILVYHLDGGRTVAMRARVAHRAAAGRSAAAAIRSAGAIGRQPYEYCIDRVLADRARPNAIAHGQSA